MNTFNIPEQYYQGINFPCNVKLQNYLQLQPLINCKLFDHLQLTCRIGSDSLHALVYSGILDGMYVAVKILKKTKQFDNEFYINRLIFSDTLNNQYFLYLIGATICDNKGLFVMEMAISDVKQRLLYSTITMQDLDNTVNEVLQSLLRLARYRIYHGDLHLGNVFYVCRNNYFRAVIGDFGESKLSDSPTTSSSDLFQFINALRQQINDPFFLEKLNIFFKNIGKISVCLEDKFDHYLQSMSECDAVIKCNVEFIESSIEAWHTRMDI